MRARIRSFWHNNPGGVEYTGRMKNAFINKGLFQKRRFQWNFYKSDDEPSSF